MCSHNFQEPQLSRHPTLPHYLWALRVQKEGGGRAGQ